MTYRKHACNIDRLGKLIKWNEMLPLMENWLTEMSTERFNRNRSESLTSFYVK